AHVDLNTAEGLQWLQENMAGDSVELFTASKTYSGERNLEIFSLIQQGAEISDGKMYSAISEIIHNEDSQ
ncbi:MAG: hypothetical protein KJO23_07650, partial [Bacteroidia bacterium]|nr:hypothetical protein [Bacteroidia bacterium]